MYDIVKLVKLLLRLIEKLPLLSVTIPYPVLVITVAKGRGKLVFLSKTKPLIWVCAKQILVKKISNKV